MCLCISICLFLFPMVYSDILKCLLIFDAPSDSYWFIGFFIASSDFLWCLRIAYFAFILFMCLRISASNCPLSITKFSRQLNFCICFILTSTVCSFNLGMSLLFPLLAGHKSWSFVPFPSASSWHIVWINPQRKRFLLVVYVFLFFYIHFYSFSISMQSMFDARV